jgi:hypothetical protein
MDLEEDLVEVDGDSVSEEVLPPGLLLAWEGEDCQDVAISLVELRGCLSRRLIPLMVAPGLYLIMEEWLIRELCHMAVMLGDLWEQCQEQIPMLRR